MPYPGQFLRLVIIGNLYSDVFNTSLSLIPADPEDLELAPVGALLLSGIATVVEDWWEDVTAGEGPQTINQSALTSIKLNRIGTDGKYMDSPTMEHVYPAPIAGLYSGTMAPQLSLVATLRTALPRGRGSKGRMYLPPTSTMATIQADGRVNVAAATQQANSVKTLINRLNDHTALVTTVGVASDAGAGRFEPVTEVACGRVVDTMRSRRSAQEEDYQVVAL